MSIELLPPLGHGWFEWAMEADKRRAKLTPIELSLLKLWEKVAADVFHEMMLAKESEDGAATADPRAPC